MMFTFVPVPTETSLTGIPAFTFKRTFMTEPRNLLSHYKVKKSKSVPYMKRETTQLQKRPKHDKQKQRHGQLLWEEAERTNM